MTANRCELWGGGCSGPQPRPGVVPHEYAQALRLNGLGRPVTDFDDPRLENPELLLLHGFQWSEEGFRGRTRNAEIYQLVQYLADGSVRLISRVGNRQHEALQSADGRVECSLRQSSSALEVVL